MCFDMKLSYFNIKALAEPIRLLLKYGNIEYFDVRLEKEQWPEVKPKTPFGQMPMLEENGKTAHQSVAIARYVAKKVKLVGNSDWDNLEIDAVVDTINDFRGKIAPYHYEQDPAVKASRKGPLFEDIIPFYLEKFEQIAKENNGHFAIGKLTWADFFFVGLLDYLNSMADMDLTQNYPNLKKVVQNVVSIPSIKTWIEIRPKTQF